MTEETETNRPDHRNGALRNGDAPLVKDTPAKGDIDDAGPSVDELAAGGSSGGGNGRRGRPGAGRPGGWQGNRGGRWQGRDLTHGSIPKNLWGMAWPQGVEGVLRIVDQILDLIWAGFLGTPHIAGIGVAQQYTQMAWSARQGIDTAQRAMVSRAIGMGNVGLAQLSVFQAATVTFGFAFVVSGVGIILTVPLLRLLGVSESVIDEAAPYMRIQFAGQGILGFQQLFAHALMASGDPITPMRAHIVSRVSHGLLSPLLIFGFLGLPEFGIAGAAIASAAGNVLALIMVTRALLSGRSGLHLKLSEYTLDPKLLWQILRIGGPAAINGAERSIAQLMVIGFVTPFGDNALAAFTLTRRLEMFANLGSQGFGQASGVIVGQNLGAGNPSRARLTILWALGFVMSMKSVLTLFLFLFPQVFLTMFTRDPELIAVASTWVRIQAIGNLALGPGNVFTQSFMTAGATVFPTVVTLFALWGIQLPLAYLLTGPLGAGQFGVPWAIAIASLARPICHVPYFLSGRWMRAQIFSDSQSPPAKTAVATLSSG